MLEPSDWLPPLIYLDQFDGNWSAYMDALYECFQEDFVHEPRPTFCGLRVGLQRVPEVEGRHGSFWHLLSTGHEEESRLADLRRCERIRWARAMLDACPSDHVHWWKNRRGRDTHIVIALPDFSYVVALADRNSYTLLCSAYDVGEEFRRGKLRREHAEYWARKG